MIFQKNAPAGPKPKDITSWIAKLSLTPAKKTRLRIYTDKLVSLYFKLTKDKQKGLDRLAVDWGLPCGLTSKLNDKLLLQVLAAAITLSN